MATLVQYWIIKTKDGREDPSWRRQGPYNRRHAARTYRNQMVSVSLRLGELAPGEDYAVIGEEIARDTHRAGR
jgi:hypothetical protein